MIKIQSPSYSPFVEESPAYHTMIDSSGREVLSTTPVSIPIPVAPAPSSMMQLMHQLYKSMAEQEQNVETFSDADDFDVPDELGIEMMSTPYEQNFDHITGNTAPPAEPSEVSAQPEEVEK